MNSPTENLTASFSSEAELAAGREEAESFSALPESPPASIVDVMQHLRAIRHFESRSRALEAEKTLVLGSYERWFNARAEALAERIERYKTSLKAYLDASGIRKQATPEGTVYLASRTKTTYPEDAPLVAWSKEHGVTVRVKESPDKKAVLAHVERTGEAPAGFCQESVETVAIRG